LVGVHVDESWWLVRFLSPAGVGVAESCELEAIYVAPATLFAPRYEYCINRAVQAKCFQESYIHIHSGIEL